MADEFSPGEIINDAELVKKLMFRVWNRVFERKGCTLTAESTRYALAALQTYYQQHNQLSEFASGMHYQIQEWSPTGLAKTVAKVENVSVAHACFEGAVKAYPKSVLTMHHGAMLMRFETGEPDTAKQELLNRVRTGKI